MTELARIALLLSRLGRTAPGVRVGIGDDAAVLDAGAGSLVWTVDAQVEGTHFRSSWVSWEDVGWRSYMAAASDLAAMGAEPVAALSSLVLAPAIDDAALDTIARGQAAAADVVGAPVIGGNLARGTETSITTTLLGRVSAADALLRRGARAGDGLWLAGPVGLAAAGLAALEAGAVADRAAEDPAPGQAALQEPAPAELALAACLAAWRRPVARIAEGRALAGIASAAIDISDGLAHDAWQLAEASDVHLVLDGAAVLGAAGEALVRAARALGRDALELALHGGEDYALLAASAKPLPGFVRIGSVTNGTGGAARVMLATGRGTEALDPRGFDHFEKR